MSSWAGGELSSTPTGSKAARDTAQDVRGGASKNSPTTPYAATVRAESDGVVGYGWNVIKTTMTAVDATKDAARVAKKSAKQKDAATARLLGKANGLDGEAEFGHASSERPVRSEEGGLNDATHCLRRRRRRPAGSLGRAAAAGPDRLIRRHVNGAARLAGPAGPAGPGDGHHAVAIQKIVELRDVFSSPPRSWSTGWATSARATLGMSRMGATRTGSCASTMASTPTQLGSRFDPQILDESPTTPLAEGSAGPLPGDRRGTAQSSAGPRTAPVAGAPRGRTLSSATRSASRTQRKLGVDTTLLRDQA